MNCVRFGQGTSMPDKLSVSNRVRSELPPPIRLPFREGPGEGSRSITSHTLIFRPPPSPAATLGSCHVTAYAVDTRSIFVAMRRTSTTDEKIGVRGCISLFVRRYARNRRFKLTFTGSSKPAKARRGASRTGWRRVYPPHR